jgi:hypothetical protein
MGRSDFSWLRNDTPWSPTEGLLHLLVAFQQVKGGGVLHEAMQVHASLQGRRGVATQVATQVRRRHRH